MFSTQRLHVEYRPYWPRHTYGRYNIALRHVFDYQLKDSARLPTQLFATAAPVAAVAPPVRQLCSSAHDTAEMQASANTLPDSAVGAGTSGEANDALRYSYARLYGR